MGNRLTVHLETDKDISEGKREALEARNVVETPAQPVKYI
jgi:hypothetical protein